MHAKHVVMACWNRVTAQIVKGLPQPAGRRPLLRPQGTADLPPRASLNNWRAFADAKDQQPSPRVATASFWDSTQPPPSAAASAPVYGPTPNTPDQPAVLNFQWFPPDTPTPHQLSAYEIGPAAVVGAAASPTWSPPCTTRSTERSTPMEATSSPSETSTKIMINRWNYGYAHEFTSPSGTPPCTVPMPSSHSGKQRSNHSATSPSQTPTPRRLHHLHSAVQEGYRAVQELP